MKLYKETKIGIIVTLIIAGFIWGLNFLKGRNFFSTTKEYYALYENIGGLKKSSTVYANGYTVGRVSDVEFLPGDVNKVLVEISVERQFNIPKNSVVEIFNSDLMGSKAVKLILGDSKEFAEDGDTLKPQFEEDLSSLMAKQILPLKEKTERLVVSIDSVMSAINQTLDAKTRKNLRSSVDGLEEMIVTQREKIAEILNHLESVSANLQKSNKNISNLISNASSISDSIASSKLKTAINQASLAMEQTNSILAKINKGQGTVGQLVNNEDLYRSLQKTITHLDSLVVDLNTHPKKYVHFSVFGKKQ
jgi:phospholipid/cholesterol/gamma-HCH transport system substrate-binding protein